MTTGAEILAALALTLGSLASEYERAAFIAGVIFMLLGAYLRWRLPYERMAVEEYEKERRMTEEQARQRVKLIRYAGPISVLIGLALFTLVLWR